jgi:hypothetical protein
MAGKFATSISMKGPFFTADIRKTVTENKRDFLDTLAKAGESDVQAQLRAGQSQRLPLGGGIQPGRVSAHVVGRTSNLQGRRWRATAKVSVNTQGLSRKQAIKLMAAASWLESQIHAFRRTRGRLARLARKADLLKGLR